MVRRSWVVVEFRSIGFFRRLIRLSFEFRGGCGGWSERVYVYGSLEGR